MHDVCVLLFVLSLSCVFVVDARLHFNDQNGKLKKRKAATVLFILIALSF